MKTFSAVCVIAVLTVYPSNGFAADSFGQSIRPLSRDYCVTCFVALFHHWETE